MLGHFPTPLTDELLYSVCARYASRVQYAGVETVNLELFGSRSLAAVIDLPCHLSYLDTNLPFGHSLKPKTLIYENTLLGFYSPFLPPERVTRIITEMAGGDGSAVHKLAGVTASTVRRPDWLRFCPLCVAADRQKDGCYWHRVHQVPGVLVCPAHSVFLANSTARSRNRIDHAAYIPAEQAITATTPKPLSLSDPYHIILLTLARDVEWLLSQRELALGFETMRTGYLKLLINHRLASDGGRIRTDKLIEFLRSYYSTDILETLQCNFDERKANNWPSRIVKNLNQGKVHHPLRHLLLIQALGQTASSFFELCRKETSSTLRPSKPFGEGPWPCLNPVCGHLHKPVITAVTISKHWQQSQTSVGIFQCHCGFTYSRNGPDKSRKDYYRFDHIKSYGSVWDGKLKEIWEDLSVSVNEASLMLGVNDNTVKYQATRIGLKFPRHGPGPKIMKVNAKVRERVKWQRRKTSSAAKSKKRQGFRRKWLEAIRKHPWVNRSRLQQQIAPHEYYWLHHHDREWLQAHMPPPYRRVGSARQVDWQRRDAEFSIQVLKTALRLRNSEGLPIRVTKMSIGRVLDRKDWLSNKQLNKLPLTVKVLEELLESRIELAIRRVRWAARCFSDEGQSPAWSTLAIRARIGWEIWYVPEVKAVIDAEWSALQDLSNQTSVAAA